MAKPTIKETRFAKEMLSEVARQLDVQENMALYRYWLLKKLLVPIEREELDHYGITEEKVLDMNATKLDMLFDESKILKNSPHRSGLGGAWEKAQRRSLVLSGVNMVIEYLVNLLDSRSGDQRLTVNSNQIIFERGDDESVLGDRLYVGQEVEYGGGDSVRLKFATGNRNGLDLRLGWGSRDNWINGTDCSINEPGDLPGFTEIYKLGDQHDRAWESIASGYYFAIGSAFECGENRWAAELTNTARGGNPIRVGVPWANPVR